MDRSVGQYIKYISFAVGGFYLGATLSKLDSDTNKGIAQADNSPKDMPIADYVNNGEIDKAEMLANDYSQQITDAFYAAIRKEKYKLAENI